MNINDTMHPAQVAILHALLFRPSASFAELQKASALSSDHFNFHLKKMLAQGVIYKIESGHYQLTIIGKEYANRFDTDERIIERQPKVAVLLLIQRDDGAWLCQQRLKQPYYGFWGRPTGKIRYGETILEAGARELLEETELTATLELRGIYHKMDYKQHTNDLLEDKIFFNLFGTKPRGTLKEVFEGGRNAWLHTHELQKLDKVFEGVDKPEEMIQDSITFEERRHEYSSDEY